MDNILPNQVGGTPADHLPAISTFTEIVQFVERAPVAAAVICVVTLGALTLAYFVARRLLRTAGRAVAVVYRAAGRAARRCRPEDALTMGAAAIATGVSAQGMWNFFTGEFPELAWPLRLLLFAFIEIAVVTSAVRARRSMRENYSAGIDGVAVWALAALTAVLASLEAATFPEWLFRLSAPLVAAWLWERGMAIERRRITGRSRIHWRFTLERVMVWLGLAEAAERTADEVDRQRRLTRVALAAQRLRGLKATSAAGWRIRWAAARLRRAWTTAARHTDIARDPEMQSALAREVRALGAADQLADLTPWASWSPRPFDPDREETARRAVASLQAWTRDRSPVATSDQDATDHATSCATDRATATVTEIPTPRRRLVGTPGSPWPVGHIVPIQAVPNTDGGILPPQVTPAVTATPVVPDRPTDQVAPVADRSRPSGRPGRGGSDHEQAIAYIQDFLAREGRWPRKRELAGALGRGATWWLDRLQEARQRAQGQAADAAGSRPVAADQATA